MTNLPLLAAATAAPPSASAAQPAIDAVGQAVAAVQMPAQQAPITAADVAQHIDPGQVAAYLPPQQPMTTLASISHDVANLLENATIAALFAVGLFLLARLLHAWLIHRSLRRALDAKSGEASALIDKINKPYEPAGLPLAGRRPSLSGGDDLGGLVLIAIGAAMAGFGIIQGDESTIREALGAALFPTFVGIALLLRRRWLKRERLEEQAAERG